MKKILSINKVIFGAVFVFGFSLLCVSAGAAQAGTAVLNWNAVTTNSDQTPISDLAGYKIYYDTSSHSGTCPVGYANSVNAGNVTTYTLNNLPNGAVYYFQVTAVDTNNNESACSTSPGEVSKVINFPGDLDKNRNVNIFDYNIFLGEFGQTGCPNVADITGDCKVDIFDYNLLLPDFGKSF